jgi:methyl-accepting chemotaxis protein
MGAANHAIEELYHKDMAHILELSLILEKAGDSRSQALLSLQHDPESPFSMMHDHPVSMHVDAIKINLAEIDKHWAAYKGSHLGDEEKGLVSVFEQEIHKLEKEGFEKIIGSLQGGQYYEANRVLLEVVNPTLKEITGTIESLLAIQEEEAAAFYEESNRTYSSMITWVGVAMGIGALISLFLAYLTISDITKGVAQVQKTADELAAGNLTARVDYKSKDEVGRISDAVNQIADQFHSAVGKIMDSVSQLASAAEETSVVTGQTNEGINQQLTETSQVATAINEMSATVQEVARNAVDAAGAAQEADTTFVQGKQVIDKVITAIGDLAGEVEKAGGVIQELEGESKNIGSVLDVIKSIAEQTNLLALNAAIEAARAGEQGRGFAVVADEVRTLAGRTQESTQEIEEMITRLQSGANNAVKVMAEGKEMTLVGVDQAAAAGEALQTINESVTRISDMNTQIASAAEEQSAVTEEINRSIVNINQVAEQSATGAQHVSAASDDLARLAEQLKGLVENFKI